MSIEIPTKDDFLALQQQTARLQTTLDHILQHTMIPQTITAEEIAKYEGVSRSQIYEAGRYLLPRFGESAFPGGKKRWPFSEYLNWREKDPSDREIQFRANLEDERKRGITG